MLPGLRRPSNGAGGRWLFLSLIWPQELDSRALEMQLSEIHGKLQKMEAGQKCSAQEQETSQTEDRMSVQLSKLQSDFTEDIKEVKAEVSAGKATWGTPS